jgi:hypothetical protein
MSPPVAPKSTPASFEPFEERWFAEHEERRRMFRSAWSTPPPPPSPLLSIGDPLADAWFR